MKFHHINPLPVNTYIRMRLIESKTTLREGGGNPILVSKICNPRRGLPSRGCCKSWTRGWDSWVPHSMWWLIIFLFLSKNVQYKSKTQTRCDFSRLFGVDVLWHHRWITYGIGLSHPPGWDNISPDVKIGGYSCLKSEKTFPQMCKFRVHICLHWEKTVLYAD